MGDFLEFEEVLGTVAEVVFVWLGCFESLGKEEPVHGFLSPAFGEVIDGFLVALFNELGDNYVHG